MLFVKLVLLSKVCSTIKWSATEIMCDIWLHIQATDDHAHKIPPKQIENVKE